MDKKRISSGKRYPQSARKLPANVASLEPIPAQLLQAQALAYPDQVGQQRVARVRVGETPTLSPSLPDVTQNPDKSTVRRRVMMLGLRGIPNLQGGIEKHVEMLSRDLVVRGWDVDVLGRSQYMPEKKPTMWRGIR